MDKNQYDNLISQAEQKYKKICQKAEKERLETIKAIEKVWAALNESQKEDVNAKPKKPFKYASARRKRTETYGALTKAVINALQDIPKNFTKNHVKKALKKSECDVARDCSNSSLSGCLTRLQRKGLIEITKRGKGSTPTKYRQRYVE